MSFDLEDTSVGESPCRKTRPRRNKLSHKLLERVFVSRVVVFSVFRSRLKYLTPEALNVTLHTVGFY